MNDFETTLPELAELVADPERGFFALIGSMGGISHVEGDIEPSSSRPGDWYVETEHGVLFFEGDEPIAVREFISE